MLDMPDTDVEEVVAGKEESRVVPSVFEGVMETVDL